MTWAVVQGDCREVLRRLSSDSVDSFVTDPPYGIEFMTKAWDRQVPSPDYWTEALRVLKPGGHLVSFGAPRIYHRLACSIEDAGFELRDSLMWLYGSGFPKSHNLAPAIDKRLGAMGHRGAAFNHAGDGAQDMRGNTPGAMGPHEGITPEAQQWAGWGTALKPAYEPIVLARKPFKGAVAANVLEHGTGALNVDACRVPVTGGRPKIVRAEGSIQASSYDMGCSAAAGTTDLGRWPANLILDEGVAAALGSQARYFYCPKASRAEREAGLEHFAAGTVSDGRATAADNAYQRGKTARRNRHPTVKPIALMQWCCTLVTPPGGVVIDPFCGSGSTGIAAVRAGLDFAGIEQDPEFVALAQARIQHWESQ